MKFFKTLLFIALSTNLWAQTPQQQLDNARQLSQQKKHSEALALYQQTAKNASDAKSWEIYSQATLAAWSLENENAAIEQLVSTLQKAQTEVAQLQKNLSPQHKEIGWWFLQMATWYANADEPRKSKSYNQMADDILVNSENDQDYRAIDYYLSKADNLLWSNKGNEGKVFFDKAKQLALAQYGAENEKTLPVLLLETYFLDPIPACQKHLDKVMALANKLIPNKEDVIFAKINFTYGFLDHYISTEDKSKTEAFFCKAAAIYEKNGRYAAAANAYQQIGIAHKDTRARFKPGIDPRHKVFTEKSIFYLNKAIETHLKARVKNPITLATAYMNLGFAINESTQELENLPNQRTWLEAMPEGLAYFHKGLLALAPDIPKDDVFYAPDASQPLPYISSLHWFGRLLDAKAVTFHIAYTKTNDSKYLELEHRCLKALEQLQLQREQSINNTQDKLDCLNSLQYNYARQVEFAYTLYQKDKDKKHLNEIFELIERSKSILLMRALQSKENQHLSGVPSEIASEEDRLKQQMQDNLKAIVDADAEGNTALSSQLKDERFKLTQAYNSLVKKMKEKYPQYFQLSQHHEVISLTQLQTLLDDKTTFLQFLEGADDNSYYILSVSKNQADIAFSKGKIAMGTAVGTKKDEHGVEYAMRDRIASLRNTLEDWVAIKNNPKQAYRDFTFNAKVMYDSLYLKKLIPSGTKLLVVSPDGSLNNIPFEILLQSAADTQKLDFSSLDYLIKSYAIQYTYSATLLEQNMRKNTDNGGLIAGFAASYGQLSSEQIAALPRNQQQKELRYALADLPGAKNELRELQKLYAGDYFFDSLASEQQFKQLKFKDYSIIHFAMHGLMDKENALSSSLAFTEQGDTSEDNFLYLHEISFMNIPAELIVLSACETGYGKYNSGEGVLSLARSFMYAGVPSIVMTLWEVNDASTSQIMASFYQHLAAGKNKAEALQQAKLQYLSIAKSTAAHPAFWSPFVQLGDSRPIAIGKDNRTGKTIWYIVAGIGFLGIIWLSMRRKKQE